MEDREIVALYWQRDQEAIPPPKEVILDRPFVYLLVDCRENTPLFLGAMMDPTG